MTTEPTHGQPETRPSEVRSDALLETLGVCTEALRTAEAYLVERGIEYRGTVGRTKVLPAIRDAIAKADSVSNDEAQRRASDQP